MYFVATASDCVRVNLAVHISHAFKPAYVLCVNFYCHFMSFSHQYIRGYYCSMVSRKNAVRPRVLLGLVFISPESYQLDNLIVTQRC